MKKMFSWFLAGALVLILTAPSQAHYLWLNIDQTEVQPQKAVGVEIGWGHKFPKHQKCPADKLQAVRALDSSGQQVPVKQKEPGKYELTPQKQGCLLVLTSYAPGFFTKTTDGYKMQNKKGLKEVIQCFRYDMRAKALVPVGDGSGFDRLAGDILEITPMKNIAALKKGDILPVKVWFKGTPLAGAAVQATFVGFSDKPGEFAINTKTDAKGVAVIEIKSEGPQFIAASHKTPYADKTECDEMLFKYMLTFNVK